MNSWGRGKRGGALRPEMQPNDILQSCSDWSNVSVLTDPISIDVRFFFTWLVAVIVSLPVHQLHMGQFLLHHLYFTCRRSCWLVMWGWQIIFVFEWRQKLVYWTLKRRPLCTLQSDVLPVFHCITLHFPSLIIKNHQLTVRCIQAICIHAGWFLTI